MSTTPTTLCAGCEKEGKVRCTGCHKSGILTRYCSIECQKLLWRTHKYHCGKHNGLFVHPDVTKEELYEFAGLLLIAEGEKEPANDDRNSVLIPVSFNFSSTIAGILQYFPPISPRDVRNGSAETLKFYASFAKEYYAENAITSQEIQSINNFGIRNQTVILAEPTKNLSTPFITQSYGHMAEINIVQIEKNPNQWISTSSNYNFLTLNYFTILAAGDKSKSYVTSARGKSLCSRILKEAAKLKREGNLKYFERGHETFVAGFSRYV